MEGLLLVSGSCKGMHSDDTWGERVGISKSSSHHAVGGMTTVTSSGPSESEGKNIDNSWPAPVIDREGKQ